MKKALVMTFVLVLGLGFAAFADGTLSGVWGTDISLYPAASEFGDFIKSFTSAIDVDYTIGGFVFGVESTFGLLGLTGMDFNVDGALGAFTFDFDIDFDPHVLATKKLTYYGLKCVPACGDLIGVGWEQMVDSSTYTAGFDDMWAEVSVSIAGVNLAATFGMEGSANEYAETVHTQWLAQKPVYSLTQTCSVTAVQTGSYLNADTTTVGMGWKFRASGSFGGATLTALAYFNMDEDSTYEDNYGYADVFFADHFTQSGVFSLVCADCIVRFTHLDIILEDVGFGCTSFSTLVAFGCSGFEEALLLIEDIGFGCCWDLGIDLLITFTDKTKSLAIEPEITLANACFTIDAVVTTIGGTGGDEFTIDGIEIRGLAIEYTWNGITFTAEESWNLKANPILGSYNKGYISSPNKIYLWEPDIDQQGATFTLTDGTCDFNVAAAPVVNTSGVGYYQLKSFACERAKAWQHLGIEVDGDSCCGGAFDISADFYFGDVYTLAITSGDYYYNISNVAAWGAPYLTFYGAYDATDSGPSARTPWAASTGPCDADTCGWAVDTVDWNYDYGSLKDPDRLFDWVKTAVDVEIGIGSAFDLIFGLDVSLWGWEDFTFGFEFTF